MVAPAGIFSLPLKYLRDTLAASASFQVWVGAADATEAAARVFYVSTAAMTLPLAVLDWGAGDLEADAGGSRSWYRQEGELLLLLRGSVSSSEDADEAAEAMNFMNTIGVIVSEVLALSGQPGYLDVLRVSHGPPVRPTHKQAKTSGDFYQVELRVRYRGSA